MNINDLPKGSYQVVNQPEGLNINSLPQGSYTPVSTPSPTPFNAGNIYATSSGAQQGDNTNLPSTIAKAGVNLVLGPAETVGTRLGQGLGVATAYGAQALGNQSLADKIWANLAKPQTTLTGGTVAPVEPGAAGVKQVAGEGLNAALTYAPLGTIAKGASAGLQAAGVASKVAGPLSTIGTGAAAGYGFDQASQLAQGKSPDLKPGLGTAIGAVIPAIGETLSALHNTIFPPTIEENALRALGSGGKTGLSGASGGKAQQSAKGLAVINSLASDIKIVDAQGIEKPFNPSKANYTELPQALEQAKNKIYQEYTNLAQQAGDTGAQFTQKDLYTIVDRLNGLKQNATADIRNAVDRELANFTSMYSTFNTKNPGASLADLQAFLQSINRSVNPFSDASKATVANEMSSAIRQVLDSKITAATGEQYQALRSSYAALKNIEPQVIQQWKKTIKPGGLTSNLLNAIGTVDFIQGVATKSAPESLRGLLFYGAKEALKYLGSGEKNLRKAFELINGASTESLGQKALNLYPGNLVNK